MIEIINVSKSYQTQSGILHALNNVSLTIPAGEIFGVIGKSGAGKSTLIRCVNFLEKPTQGSVRINGKSLNDLSNQELREARHQIGMIFQHFNLLSQRSVFDNVALPLIIMGQSKSQIRKTVMPLLELTGLIAKEKNYPAELSGGQKQRVAIARAMASNPKVLLCDEATSALDQYTTQNILQLLKEINQSLGLTILLITHEIDVIKQICDQVALINNGELIEQAEIFEFFTKPKTLLAQEFVKSSLKQELPAILQHQFISSPEQNSNAILRIIFHGKAAAQPLIAHLMQDFGIRLNILQANIEFLKKDSLGIMITEVISHAGRLENAIQYLTQQDVSVEVIGYVNRNA